GLVDRAVIADAEKQRRGGEDAREVEGVVKIAARHRSLIEGGDAHDVLALDLRGPGEAHRVDEVGAEGRARARQPRLAAAPPSGALPAPRQVVGVAEELIGPAPEREATQERGAVLAPLAEEPVARTHGEGGSGVGALPPLAAQAHADAALGREPRGLGVGEATALDGAMERRRALVVERRRR